MGDQAESNMDQASDQVVESITTVIKEPHADPSSGVNDEAHNRPDCQIAISSVKKDEPEMVGDTQASAVTEIPKKENADPPELCERGPQVAPGCEALGREGEPSGEDMEVSVSTKMETLGFSEDSAAAQGNLDFGGSSSAMFPEAHLLLKDEKEQFVSEDSDDSSSSEDSSSDSDSDSSLSSSSSSSSSEPMAAVLGEEDDFEGNKSAPMKTQGEILIEELPAVEDVVVFLPEDTEMQPIGIVSRIIDKLVIIESLKDTPPLNEDSVIFNKDRQSVGKVFEIFGPVPQPYYVLRFNSVGHMAEKGLTLHETVYFAPSLKDFTDYVFTEQLKMGKGSDASWKNDQEPPPEALDFSDDEQEKAAKQKKNKKQAKRQRWPEQGENDNSSGQSVHSRQPAESRRGGRGGGGGYRGPGFSHQPTGGFHNRCFPHSNAAMMNWGPHQHSHPLNNRMMVENRLGIVPPPYPVPFQHQPPPPYLPPFPPPPVPGHMTMPWPGPPMGPPPTLHGMAFGHVPPPPPPPPPTPSTQPQ